MYIQWESASRVRIMESEHLANDVLPDRFSLDYYVCKTKSTGPTGSPTIFYVGSKKRKENKKEEGGRKQVHEYLLFMNSLR